MIRTYLFEEENKGSLELKVNDEKLKRFAQQHQPDCQPTWEGMSLVSELDLTAFYEWQSIEYAFTPTAALEEKAPFSLMINRKKVATSRRLGDRVLLHGNYQFKNAIGPTEISIIDKYNQIIFRLETEVYPQKIDYKEDYKEMMADITRIVYNLAYDYFKDTYERGRLKETGQATLLEFVAIIRVLFESLDKSIEVIRRQPKHQIQEYQRVKSVHHVKKLAGQFPKWIRSNQQYINQDKKGIDIGHGYHMSHAPEQKKKVTFDTYENRFVAWAIRQLLVQLRTVRELLMKNYPDAVQDHLLFDRFFRRLRQRLQHDPFNEVSAFEHQLHFSTTLTMAAGYKDFLHKFLLLQRGLSLADNDIFRIDIKDIATLYEYWCFLKIVDLLKTDPNYQLESQDLIKVKGGRFVLSLKTGQQSKLKFHTQRSGETMELFFNRRFSKKGGKVFTYDQKPDYAIQFRKSGYKNPFWFLFDAKYRFDEAEKEGKLEYHAPQDAIGQLHRYRDAILHSQPQGDITYRAAVKNLGGVILYPYPNSEEDFIRNPFYKSIEDVNIGALPFLPTKTSLFKGFLDKLLLTSPERHFEQFLEMDRSEYESHLKELQEVLVIGLVPSSEENLRKDFLFNKGYYAIRFNANTRLKIFRAAWFVPYFQSGHVLENLYEVQSIKVMSALELKELGASWRLSSDLYLVYQVQKEESFLIKRSLPLQAGYRYSNPLAFNLFREKKDPQLISLNDFNAIRLYRELTARQIGFSITKGKEVSIPNQELKVAELRFELENGTVIYNVPGLNKMNWQDEVGNHLSIDDLLSKF